MVKLDKSQKKKYKWSINIWFKMLKIFSHQGNANQDYNEIPSHPS